MQNSKKWIKYLKLKEKTVEIQDGRYSSGFKKTHTVQNSKEWINYLKLKKNKMAHIVQDYTKKNVWMPPVPTQNKESMLCQTKGVSIFPIHLDALIRLDAPCMFDAPYVMMPLMFGWLPISLDAPHMPPCMFRHPLFGCLLCLDDVWMALYIHNTKKACFVRLGVSICPHTFGCPMYINNTNKACFVRLRGVNMPHTFGCPCMFRCCHMFGCTPICLNAPICLDTPICMDAHMYL